MIIKDAPSYYYNIWLAGDYDDARRACREFCSQEGACVTVTPVSYIYTGGEEAGVCVRMLNYPRFPAQPDELWAKAWRLAEHLRVRLHQDSVLVEAPYQIRWSSFRHGVQADDGECTG